jgi:hypothetical protein
MRLEESNKTGAFQLGINLAEFSDNGFPLILVIERMQLYNLYFGEIEEALVGVLFN